MNWWLVLWSLAGCGGDDVGRSDGPRLASPNRGSRISLLGFRFLEISLFCPVICLDFVIGVGLSLFIQ